MQTYTAFGPEGLHFLVLATPIHVATVSKEQKLPDGLYVLKTGDHVVGIFTVTDGVIGRPIDPADTIPRLPAEDGATFEELLKVMENTAELIDKGAKCAYCPLIHHASELSVPRAGLISLLHSAIAKLKAEEKEVELAATAANAATQEQLARLRALLAWQQVKISSK